MIDRCKLCGIEAELQKSHIIPRFVHKWLKETSILSDGLINIADPNRPIQDGEKIYMLCRACEQRFGQWEKIFRNKVFLPVSRNLYLPTKYEKWLIQFAVSISWRVLTLIKDAGLLRRCSDEFFPNIDTALTTWEHFLLGKIKNPGNHEQHIVSLDFVGRNSFSGISATYIPININKYFLRTIEMDVGHFQDCGFVYSKLGRILILGFINVPDRRYWTGTKVHVSRGLLFTSNTYRLPYWLSQFIFMKARKNMEKLKKMSESRRDRIRIRINENIQHRYNTDEYRAIMQDIISFGQDTAYEDS